MSSRDRSHVELAGALRRGWPWRSPPPPRAQPYDDAAAARRAAPAGDRRTESRPSSPNGLRVIVARRDGMPLVTRRAGRAGRAARSIRRACRPRLADRRADDARAPGGTARRRSPPRPKRSAARSTAAPAGTSRGVSITVTTPKLDAALALVAEVAREPAFAPSRDSSASAPRRSTSSRSPTPARARSPALVAAAPRLRRGAYGHPASGTPASLPRIARDDLVRCTGAASGPTTRC